MHQQALKKATLKKQSKEEPQQVLENRRYAKIPNHTIFSLCLKKGLENSSDRSQYELLTELNTLNESL